MSAFFLLLSLTLTVLSTLNGELTNFVDKDSKLVGFAEKQWFRENIPFIEVPDKNIEDVYYYRWASHKRHLRYLTLGAGYMVTEFVHDVLRDVHDVRTSTKFGIINAAGGHHIYESRWLRNQRYVKDYINIYARQEDKRGNHKYSEWIANAAYNTYLLNGDNEFMKSQLNGFVKIYNEWADYFEPKLGLYYISPNLDDQEFSAASVQTKDKYGGGLGYRPSHNSEMYGNAMAIVKMAQLNNDVKTENDFKARAKALRESIITHLWDKQRNFFYHVQRLENSNNSLLDTREEVGFYPWRWEVPDDRYNFSVAWDSLFDPKEFDSKYGPTTCEMSSKWYDGNQKNPKCCWWNGNSWPYSTAHILKSLAVQIKHYKQQNTDITVDNYVSALHKYAVTQYKDNVPYVAECHSPQGDFWVCDSRNHSEHYAHSTYTDNVLSELIGITPRSDDNFEIDPLIPTTWKYFIAENVLYHGHDITVLYDHDGTRYKVGAGMKVYVNGKVAASQANIGKMVVPISKPLIKPEGGRRLENYAANIKSQYYPKPSASFTDKMGSTYQAVDGRIFYDNIPSNRWSNWDSGHDEDWFAVDFGRAKTVNSVHLYIYSDVVIGKGGTDCPTKMNVQYHDGTNWKDAANQVSNPEHCSPNDVNKISFSAVKTNQIRVVFTRDKAKGHYVGITEFEVWAEWPQTPETYIYEFEDGVITDALMESSATASGNSFVGGIYMKSSNVELSGIYSDITGDYVVRIYYANGEKEPATHTLQINNIHTVTVTYPVTKKGWAYFDNQSFVELNLPLLKGNNVLIFQYANNFAELDKIHIVRKA